MDIAEVVLRVRPRLVDIIDFEANVRRDEARLDRGNI